MRLCPLYWVEVYVAPFRWQEATLACRVVLQMAISVGEKGREQSLTNAERIAITLALVHMLGKPSFRGKRIKTRLHNRVEMLASLGK